MQRSQTLKKNMMFFWLLLEATLTTTKKNFKFISQNTIALFFFSLALFVPFPPSPQLPTRCPWTNGLEKTQLLICIPMLSTLYNPQPSSTLSPTLPAFLPAGPPCRCRRRCSLPLPMRKRSGCSANLLEQDPLLSPCSSTLNLLLSLLHGNSCSNTCSLAPLRFIVFHTGLRWPNRLTLTVMKLPHIEPARENNI